MENQILSRKKFLGMAATIAMPIMVQNLISTLVNTADTLMLGYVGQNAMAASSLANNVNTVLWIAVSGLCAGSAVLGSQYWGKGDRETIERVLGMSIRFCCGLGLLFFAMAFCFPEHLMTIFTNDEAIISEGIVYLRVVSFSYLFMSFSLGYFAILRSIEKVILPSVVFVVSLCINVFLNATFIFGIFGLPKLGLVGVAVGTVCARAFECIACIVHSLVSKDIRFRIKYLFARTGALLSDFMTIALPAFFNDVAWSLAFSVFSVILGHMGSDVVAANAVASMALNLGAIVSRGFANATTVIVGKAIGEGDTAKAKIYGRRMVWITLAFSALGGFVILLIRPVLMTIYSDKLTEMAIYYLSAMMIMQSYHLIGEGLNTCWICGCFRGGGDTKFGMIVDTLCMWLIAVPLMALAAYVFKLPVLAVYFVMCLDEFEKLPFVLRHYLKFEWLNNITREKGEI